MLWKIRDGIEKWYIIKNQKEDVILIEKSYRHWLEIYLNY